MTRDGYIDEILTTLKKDYDESNLNRRLVGRWLDSQRVLFIKNEINKGKDINNSIMQTIENIELENVNNASIGEKDNTIQLIGTKVSIPKVVEFSHMSGLLSVRNSNLVGYEITLVKREDIKYAGSGNFNKADTHAFLYNNKIYIKIPKDNFKVSLLTHINIDGIFEEPKAVSHYRNRNNEPCYNVEYDHYPINDALWEYMLGNIINSRYLIYKREIKDKENDENDSNN